MQLVAASAEESRAMAQSAAELQSYAQQSVTPAVLKRYAFWQSLRSSAQQYGGDALLAELLGAELVNAHAQADRASRAYATMLRGLGSGALELAAWRPYEAPSPLFLAVVKQGFIPRQLGLIPLIAGVIVVGALVGAGVYLANAWTSLKTLEANTDALRARTQSAATAAIAAAAQRDPQAAATLADALERANKAASGVQPGLLDSLADAAQSVVKSVGSGGGFGWLALVAALWFASRERA